MAESGPNWSTQQLAEFLAGISAFGDEESATRAGIERAAEALEAEVGAVVRGGSVAASIGFPPGQVPQSELIAGAGDGSRTVELPGLGTCALAVVPLEGASAGRMLVARCGEGSFRHEEVHLLRSMARVLALTTRMLRVLGEEHALREKSEREVSERKEAEQALKEGERRTRQILETAHDAFVSMDSRGLVIAWNPAAEAMFGWASPEALGQPLDGLLVPAKHRQAHRLGLERFLATGEGPVLDRRIELTAVHRDGHEFPVELTITALREGESWVFNSFLRDIANRKRAEAQQAAVAALGQRALEGGDLPGLMSEAVRAVSATLGVEYATVLELLPDGEGFLVREGTGWGEDPGSIGIVPGGDASQAGYTLSSAGPVVVEDWTREHRFARVPLFERHGVMSGVTVIVHGRERPFGVLGFHTSRQRSFTSDDINFVQAVANILADAIERQGAEEEIRHQALHDPLTGLPNRTLFLDRLRHALARSRRVGSPVGVLFLDVDNFKAVNDGLSHEAGDKLLVALGARLQMALRASDTLARFGGDEFLALCEDIGDEREAVAVAERIASSLARPFSLEGSEQFVTVSIGIAVPSGGGEHADAVIRNADVAMYRVKARGRGSYELFDEGMRTRTRERLKTENDLRRSVERGELRAFYQPIVSLDSAEICGFEALLRWEHPERRLMSPAEFVPVAEESGLIVPIGSWILEEACRQTASWLGEDREPRLQLSVNLSARQLSEPDVVATVAKVIHDTEIEPESLALEITESLLFRDAESSLATLRALKALGVSLVLDDFGTGHSPLSHLTRFPIDQLKVDRSFVAGLDKEGRDSAVVGAVLSMAQALGLSVVAEGVETAEQADKLRMLGCQFAQGFYYARPFPLEDLARSLAHRLPAKAGALMV